MDTRRPASQCQVLLSICSFGWSGTYDADTRLALPLLSLVRENRYAVHALPWR